MKSQRAKISLNRRKPMNKRRIAAMLLISAAIIVGDFALLFPPAQLEARNTTIITITHQPAVVCGAMGCSGNNPVKGGHAGHTGGGVIFIGS
jgi:hypothetical protein